MQSKCFIRRGGIWLSRQENSDEQFGEGDPSVIRSDCNVCSEHLEAFGVFGFGTWLCQHKYLC